MQQNKYVYVEAQKFLEGLLDKAKTVANQLQTWVQNFAAPVFHWAQEIVIKSVNLLNECWRLCRESLNWISGRLWFMNPILEGVMRLSGWGVNKLARVLIEIALIIEMLSVVVANQTIDALVKGCFFIIFPCRVVLNFLKRIQKLLEVSADQLSGIRRHCREENNEITGNTLHFILFLPWIVLTVLNTVVGVSALFCSMLVSVFESCVVQLIKTKAEARSERTALYLVVKSMRIEDIEIAKILLESKSVDLEAKDCLGRTVLYCAVEHENSKIFKMLLDAGASTESKNNQGGSVQSCLFRLYKCYHGKAGTYNMLQEMARHGNLEAETLLSYAGPTALHDAVEEGKVANVKQLLDVVMSSGAVNAQDYQGQTALHLAAYRGHSGVVDLLLKNSDIKVNVQDNQGQSALYYAVQNGHTAVVKLMLEKGVEIGDGGFTQLIELAKQYRHTSLAQWLQKQERKIQVELLPAEDPLAAFEDGSRDAIDTPVPSADKAAAELEAGQGALGPSSMFTPGDSASGPECSHNPSDSTGADIEQLKDEVEVLSMS
jgi:ankyrin repeat protein